MIPDNFYKKEERSESWQHGGKPDRILIRKAQNVPDPLYIEKRQSKGCLFLYEKSARINEKKCSFRTTI